MARRRFFVDGICRGEAEVTGEDAEHLTRVLRAESGQQYEISDNGRVYLAEIREARKQRVCFQVLEEMPVPVSPVRVMVLAALFKFDRFEWMLEKVTELGVDRIVPVSAERSEHGLDRGADKRLARWRRIVKEASQQSRRSRMPQVESAISLTQALAVPATYRYLMNEAAVVPALAVCLPAVRRLDDCVSLLTGPEGGWTNRERDLAVQGGFQPVSLGTEILRAETAAITAVALVRHAWWTSRRAPAEGTVE